MDALLTGCSPCANRHTLPRTQLPLRNDPDTQPDWRSRLQQAVEQAAHLLPAQGPIEVFIHHNTLHAFEDLPFPEAVAKAAALYGRQPYLSEDRYRAELSRGRILSSHLSDVLIEELGDDADRLIGCLGTRFHLRLALLEHPLRSGPGAELRWLMAETDALRKFRPEASPENRQRIVNDTRHSMLQEAYLSRFAGDERLQSILNSLFAQFDLKSLDCWSAATWDSFTLHLLWEVCQLGTRQTSARIGSDGVDDVHRGSSESRVVSASQPLVNEILIRFCAAFLDQGYSHWSLPHREQGFYRSFVELYRSSRPVDGRLRMLASELTRLDTAGMTPLESLAESLQLLGGDEDEVLLSRLLALPGWAGMIWQMETNAEWAQRPAPAGTLLEYLAVRLILERVTAVGIGGCEINGDAGHTLLIQQGNAAHPAATVPGYEQRAYHVFQLAQVRGWSPFDLQRLSRSEWAMLLHELEAFSDIERRRVYHLAYERRYRQQTLDALLRHQARTPNASSPTRISPPQFQLVCCIDDREESFRRHLEEISPDCETFGVAGFFGVAMYYRGLSDAHFRPLCPNIMKPAHYVQEEVVYSLAERHRRRSATRRAFGKASLRWHIGSRSLSGGMVTGLLGSLASVPLIARVLFPRTTARLRKQVDRLIHSAPVTEVRMQRESAVPAPGPAQGQIPPHPPLESFGYTFEEMANIVERILRDIGLTSGFARLVVLLGHGSASLNNPHASAYHCGACSGGHGGANARIFCRMANHHKVRERLKEKGIEIPDETLFLGGEHNTCDDDIELFDLERLPCTHTDDVERLRTVLELARRRNALERCRRFESAPLTLTPDEALLHVESRAEDLSQARPEYNHATNAMCVVGRRELTRGLFLDRRAFLASYDPDQDDADHAILARILSAVIPVCAGISLEYYFSCVDVAGYGCGSKLPHNITSLLGVMEGAASDLRPGLSAQMTEIHEPLRVLFVVECSPQAMLSVMDRNATINRLVRNEWIQLAVIEPAARVHRFHQGRFVLYHPETTELPVVPRSQDWYRGRREHLGFAAIQAAMQAATSQPVRSHDAR